ncbi:RNase J family beta-CASP ribonuclease [Suicoccus acidiformans]|uniref:Ribonuclease J n=1 Tax=Suicoccus acidiformans TaxID=2036206 RepID=A0A347WKK3_9LACT|nr:ribonuclease J [Suicoccus acidiformans]AXY25610.1 RNase J family beta-CASP ribonuclease [Suicoccus acidiformans]
MNTVKIIPLGGVREEGKNMYVIEVNDSIFILDCGLVFPEESMLGIDAIIPDFTYVEENRDRVQGVFLTHGHDDAIGGLPYLLDIIDVPVFGTELTIELAKLSAKKQGLTDRLDQFYKVDADTEIEFEDATVSFFRTTHTIPDSVGIVVHTPEGNVVYTGDFKLDPSASELYQTDYDRLIELGKEGVLALLSDSADAESPIRSVSDSTIIKDMESIFMNAKGRVVVAAIASNISRIQQLLEVAHKTQRQIFFADDDLTDIIDLAIKLDKIQLPSRDVIGKSDRLNDTHDDEVIILQTGGVGEPIQGLNAMATGHHPKANLKEGDFVYMATTPSTAMETAMAKTKDLVYRAKAETRTINENHKVSGHASQDDLKFMLNFLKPTYLIPVNGESRMLAAHADVAEEIGYHPNQIFRANIGDVIEYKNNKMTMTATIQAGDVLVDGSGVGDIGNVVLRDRRILSEDGIFIVVATISRRLGKVLVGPQITSRGFVYMKTSIDLIQVCSDITLDVLEEHLASKQFDWGDLKNDLREKLGKYLFKETQRRPVILPIIMEASSYQPDQNPSNQHKQSKGKQNRRKKSRKQA